MQVAAVSPCDQERHCLRPCSTAKRLFSTALNHDTVQQVFEKLGSKMDFTAGVSVAALTFGSTAAFVKRQSSNMRDDVKKLDSNLRQDIKQLDK